MKKKWNVGHLCVQAVLATCALTIGVSAQAKCKSFTKCMKSGGDSIKSVGDSGVSAADKATKDLADKTARTLVEQGAAITKPEMTDLLHDAKGAYAESSGTIQNGYVTSVNKLNSVMTSLLDGIWREAGKKFVKKNEAIILDMKHRALHLDPEGKAALNRIKRAITQKDLDEQSRADMLVVMKKIVPNSVKNSSFGIQLCAAAGVGYGGQDSCFMMIMQTYLEGNVFKVGLAQSFGVAASPVPSDLGADVSFGLFWGPGGISDNSGASIGLALGAVLEEGLEVGVSWGVPTSMPNPDSAIPGISISIGLGGKVQSSLTAGYTLVAGKI
ncbi:MAG: hypothetical protein Q8R67_25560 [Rhodoferax sp.]|nr:hypothetical protein [Rhodoferax sp.]MDP3655042.1 hypothetical protein [Rhodoferax sp.]